MVARQSQTKAIAVRYGEHFSPAGGTIAAHEEVLKSQGFVWFGKMGAAVAHPRVAELNAQIAAGTPTFLVLVRARADGRIVHACRIDSVTRERPGRSEERCIPEYYRKREDVGAWFKVVAINRVDSSLLSQLTVSSSLLPLPQVLSTSVASFFYVTAPSGWGATG